MKRILYCALKYHFIVALFALFARPSLAQFTYYTTALPTGTGSFIKYYVKDRTGVNVGSQAGSVTIDPSLLLVTNISQQWDFRIGPTNALETVSVVNAANMPVNFLSAFPTATWALNYSQNIPNSGTSWDFYFKDVSGRHYLGFQDASDQTAIFESDNVDLPEKITFGTQWSRETTFTVEEEGIPVTTYFSASAIVDGFGVVNLPGLGLLPSLRIHETQEYAMYVYDVADQTYWVQTYFWLTPIGKVVEMLSTPLSSPSQPLTSTLSYTRAYQSGDLFIRFSPVHATALPSAPLQFSLQWPGMGTNVLYIVAQTGSPTFGNWNIIDATTQTSGTYLLTNSSAGFFTTLAIPQQNY